MAGDPRNTGRGRVDEFYFRAYVPGRGASGAKIIFPAHITGITDTSSPGWREEFDMGRPDPVMMYGSFNRSISITFMVVSLTKTEVADNFTALKRLANLTYPIYQSGMGYNAPHVLYNISNLIGGIGVITGIDFTWSGETPWVGEVSPKPIITDVGINIRTLTDTQGNRPSYSDGNYNYFGV